MTDENSPKPSRLIVDEDGWTVLNPEWVAYQRDLVANGSKEVPPIVNGWSRGSVSGNAGFELHRAFGEETARKHERFLVEQTVKGVARALQASGGLRPAQAVVTRKVRLGCSDAVEQKPDVPPAVLRLRARRRLRADLFADLAAAGSAIRARGLLGAAEIEATESRMPDQRGTRP